MKSEAKGDKKLQYIRGKTKQVNNPSSKLIFNQERECLDECIVKNEQGNH